MTMRRLTFALALLLAGCATAPQKPETPAVPEAPPTREPIGIVGLTTTELVGHFGKPALQIREGTSLKLQFRGQRCILDAYLYPQNNVLRVTHVDTRTLSGVDYDQAACIASLE
jgi:type IV pilus biogenesis protein CpaD/CtpE